jgi:hypothetical protein
MKHDQDRRMGVCRPWAATLRLGLLFVLAGGAVQADPPAMQPPAGYRMSAAEPGVAGIALSPGGRAALARPPKDGAAVIEVYDRLEPSERKRLQTLHAPEGDRFQFFGGMVFQDDDTLLFGENGDMDTVYSASVGTGEVQALLPNGNLPNVADLAIRPSDGRLLALVAADPGQGAVYTVADGQAAPLAKDLGVGYLSGLVFGPTGRLFVGDTGPFGEPGRILELGAGGEVVQTISLAAGGGTGLAGLAVDAEGDLFASTGATITAVRLHRGAQVREFARFAGDSPFPGGLLFRGTRFEPESGDGTLLVNAPFTAVGGLFALTPDGNRPHLPADFATAVIAADGTNGVRGYTENPERLLGPPSVKATPEIPDNSGVFSFGWGGSVTLAFDRPILNDPRHPSGMDFTVYGNALYVGGDENVSYQEPAFVEVGLDLNGNGRPDPDEPFYLLRGRPDPGSPPGFQLGSGLFGVVDHQETPVWGYADVTPTLGAGDPLVPDDPMTPGITPGSAGGDAFDLAWAVDQQGKPAALDHADFIRITHALNATSPFGVSSSEIDAVSLVRPSAR